MKTLLHFFNQSVEKFHDNVYLWENCGDGYQGTTYGETHDMVYRFAAGLISQGIKKGDRIALFSEARNDWVISEFGILFSGAVNVPLSVRMNEPEEIRFRLNHSGARCIIVSGNQISKIRQIRKDLPVLEKIIVLDEIPLTSGDELLFSAILSAGDLFLAGHRDVFDETVASVTPDDHANISYTSGTTTDPKGIILTHRNFVANVEQGYSLIDISERYTTLLILPWDHAFAHTAGIYCFMGKGASIASVQSGKTSHEFLKNLPKNIQEIKPTLLFSVPAIAKSFKNSVEKTIRSKGPFIERLFVLALKIAYFYNGDGWDRGKGLKMFLKPLYSLFDLILFSKIRSAFGGRLEFFIGGGALLDMEFQRFFYAIGVPMFQGYGLTEASPFISSNTLRRHKLGSSGVLVANLELRICDEHGTALLPGEKGEIVIKGENVMAGYWLNEDATRDTVKNGWLHTGDMGYMDRDGFLYILGRFKSLLIADDGEKYSPEGMEEAYSTQSKFIEQCILINNQHPYTIALVVPNKEALQHYLSGAGTNPVSEEGLTAALRKIEREFAEYRKGNKYGGMFPQRWLPSAIGILDEPFTEENHLLNFQLKTVRGKVIEKYSQRLDFLYTPAGKQILNEQNKLAMSVQLSGEIEPQ
ncbi:MAG: AMP-binding protein [Bacteroidales bacterium]|nr:AMP-binding protein [Bacteroidales bacterium]